MIGEFYLKKNYIKIVLDILLAIAFVLLMNPRVLNGLSFHEIGGLVFGVAILVHIALNFKWVINTAKKIFNPKLPKKTRLGFLLNLLLLITMSGIIVTGILISKVVFSSLATGENHSIRGLHGFFANTTLALVGLHVALHWQWVMSICKRAFKSKNGDIRVGVFTSVVLSIIILASGIQWVSTTFPASNKNFEQRGIASFDKGQTPTNGNAVNLDNTRMAPPNGEFRGKDGRVGSSSPFLVILQNFAILAAIIVPTYYLEKYLLRNNRKLKNS